VTYQLLPEDVMSASASRTSRAQRAWMIRVAIVATIILVARMGSAAASGRLSAAYIAIIIVYVAILMGVRFVIFNPKMRSRRAAKKLLKANPTMLSPTMLEVWPTGVRIQNAGSNHAAGWQAYPFRREEKDHILLLSGVADGMIIIPRRAIGPVEGPALAALLGQYTRLTQ
jgi:hypothetical protein